MNKIIAIHLHGRAYQVEEQGYAKLRQYLDQAAARLSQDPDRAEIISDLEQSIAEKMERFLSDRKTVVTESETDEIIREMGPVESADAGSGGQAGAAGTPPKRLYKIREAGIVAGVCAGVAAYFNIDVTLVRILFAALALITHGVWAAVYIIMMIILPEAATEAEKAAAFGVPFTAQDFINRARAEYSRFAGVRDRQAWKEEKRKWKEKRRQMKRELRQQYRGGHWAPFAPAFIGLFSAALALVWVFGLVSLIAYGTLFGLVIPASIPLWIAVLAWLVIYNFVTWPIRAALFFRYRGDGFPHGRHSGGGLFESIIWLAFIVVIVWSVWQYVPASHPFFEHAGSWWNQAVGSLRTR